MNSPRIHRHALDVELPRESDEPVVEEHAEEHHAQHWIRAARDVEEVPEHQGIHKEYDVEDGHVERLKTNPITVRMPS